jgi:hypothetical protein
MNVFKKPLPPLRSPASNHWWVSSSAALVPQAATGLGVCLGGVPGHPGRAQVARKQKRLSCNLRALSQQRLLLILPALCSLARSLAPSVHSTTFVLSFLWPSTDRPVFLYRSTDAHRLLTTTLVLPILLVFSCSPGVHRQIIQ